VARGSRGWRHASGDTRPLSTHSLAGGDAFIIAGAPIGRDAALIEAGLDLSNAHDATLACPTRVRSQAMPRITALRLGYLFVLNGRRKNFR